MPLLYNVHTPSHSFALQHKDAEGFKALVERMLSKAEVKDKKGFFESEEAGTGVKYEYEGGRWSLQDEDDLKIMQQRFPTDSTQSITLHLTPPSSANGASNSLYKSDEAKVAKAPRSSAGRSTKSHSKSSGKVNGATGAITLGPDNDGDNFESLGDKHKRAWNDFHSENGVRTVVGEIAGVKNVRMLLRLGYRGVYISRTFAAKNNLIPGTTSMGSSGYVGLVNIGQMPIKVGSKTIKHPVMLSEEQHFDVVLGRQWMEKSGVKTDPYDQTSVTYMDNGEKIDVDIVVLRDQSGEVVTVT